MPINDKDIVNLGLSHLGSYTINNLQAPSTALEKHCALVYEQCVQFELGTRNWCCATELDYLLTLDSVSASDRTALKYKFRLPNECLRVVRTPYDRWQVARGFIFAPYDTLAIDYIKRVPEADFDTFFIEVLAWRIAIACVKKVTQAIVDDATVKDKYDAAVFAAAKANAFMKPQQSTETPDEEDDWIRSRKGQLW